MSRYIIVGAVSMNKRNEMFSKQEEYTIGCLVWFYILYPNILLNSFPKSNVSQAHTILN